MNAHEIRSQFLKFFKSHDHTVVASSSVIPENDPTLLFTNAGMNQFKDVLLGHEKRDYQRAVSTQKSVRAGGKHNDLDDVGKDARHLTFFEMLGNWSFGDYYKLEAIKWAWDFITTILKVDVNRLYVTIYKDDDESFDIWTKEVGVDPARILRLGDIQNGNEENFWSMGPTGPCGPCTEIHYDLYPEDGPLDWRVGYDEERIIEFWNIVFMEYNRDVDGSLEPLAMRSVDTGMGLERVAMILAEKPTVFHTELFTPIFEKTYQLKTEDSQAKLPSDFYTADDFSDYAVIADHIRTLTFALSDGAKFSNEGRGSVLRSILRRAVRHGHKLGFEQPFLHQVVSAVVSNFKSVFPEIEPLAAQTSELIKLEEERFFRTIDSGVTLFEDVVAKLKKEGEEVIDGETLFKLHATHGFPPDMTRAMAEELGLKVDLPGYQAAWRQHQEASKGQKDVYQDVAQVGDWQILIEQATSQFVGYDSTEVETQILRYRHLEDELWELMLEETPFYAESGGQISDSGKISALDDSITFEIVDVQKGHSGIVHRVRLTAGTPTKERLSQRFKACVDVKKRQAIMKNHTATHLLHAALRQLISDTIFQSGSLVSDEKLRFDFSFDRPLTDDEIATLEHRINGQIAQGLEVYHHVDVDIEEATESMGAMAIFGEKYGERVRVIEVAPSDLKSVELCGGTHVKNTRDIQLFEITTETGVAAGIRRIEAKTGEGAIESLLQKRAEIKALSSLLKVDSQGIYSRVEGLLEERSDLSKQVQKLSQKLASSQAGTILDDAKQVDGVQIVAKKLEVDNRDQLLTYADQLKPKLSNAAVLLASEIDGKAALICMTTDSFFKEYKIKAGDLINAVAPIVGGKGGGRPTLAQAGGSQPEHLDDCLAAFVKHLSERLGAA